jgi:carbamoyltransferase
MKILGFTGGSHSCGLSYIENGKPIFSFEEERFNRIRTYKDFYNNFFRFPFESGQNTQKFKNFDWNELDYITSFFDINRVEKMWYGINLGPFPKEKFIKVDHHEAHCNLAYYCSGFKEDTLVISIDASGENYSSKFYIGSNGNLEYINGIDITLKSLGHYYSMLTEFLGFRRLKDEGKVVGRASHGKYNPRIYRIFDKCITIKGIHTDTDNGKGLLGGVYEDFYRLWFEEFGSEYYKHLMDDVAFNGQLVFEEKVLQLINNIKEKYPSLRKVAAAGGVFANVKLNKRINELDWVEEVFIAPPMGDEGLPLGCALTVHKKFNPDFKPFRLDNVFLGTEYSDEEFEFDNSKFTKEPYTPEKIAQKLKEGTVVGWFQGRYEHGPRALCNRSIIADPSVPGTYTKVNDRLQRNDFMPFAPVVIDKYANKVFDVTKSSYTAEFMTMLYDTREEWVDKIPAVVHPIDKTARIQIVTENSNSKFYELISKFNNITDIPVLLNTSFNVHGEPIVCHPKEGFVHLDNGIVDVLVVNNNVYTKK